MKQEKILKKSMRTGFAALCLLLVWGCFGTAFAEETEQAQEYIFPESDGEYLTEEELEGLPLQLIAYGKYEILARRGMLFQSEELQDYFNGQSWYFGFIGEEEFPDSLLNEIETANLQLLSQQEEALAEGGYQPDQEGFTYEPVESYLAGADVFETGLAENDGEAETRMEAETEEETEAGPETETETEPEAGSEEETETEPEAGSEAEAQTETEAQPETETAEAVRLGVYEPETGAAGEEETEPETEAETETEPETESETKTEPETETEDEPETEPEEGLSLRGYEDVHDVDLMNGGTDAASAEGGNTENASQASGGQSVHQTTGSEYIFPDVAGRYLNRSEVEALSLQAICYAKNEIYARHGRKFLSRELQEYFGSKSWYNGFVDPDDFADWVFNDYERANLDLIVSCEFAVRSDGYQLDQPGYDIYAVNTASADTSSADSAGGSRQSSTSSDDAVLNQDYIFPDSDARYLTEEEVNVLSKTAAGYAYKEILARRGCIFDTERYQNYFEGKSWYAGRISEDAFTSDMLNKFELYNLKLIKKLKAD